MSDATTEKKAGGGGVGTHRKESILELTKMMDSMVLVKCLGGRELKGLLRGFDDLVNLVLDESEEYLRGKQILSGLLTSFIQTLCSRNHF